MRLTVCQERISHRKSMFGQSTGLRIGKMVTDQLQDNEAIFIRSQPKRFFVPLGIAVALGDIIVLGMFFLNDRGILHINDSLRMTWIQYVVLAIGLPVLYVNCCFLIVSQPGLGAFRIDGNGIERTGFRKGRKYLRWEEVDRVQWTKESACFEANGVRIAILWTFITTKDETQAKPFLEKILSPYFDLSDTKSIIRLLARADWRLRRKDEPSG
jgi:hypothetical protein